MSISSAMLAGASGMRANSSAIAAISDNISNVNTVGYKRIRSDFTSQLSSQNKTTTHNAGGVLANHTTLTTEQGSPTASTVPTHLALDGNGFFVVRPRSDDATNADPFLFTRAGQFSPDADGYLRNVSGQFLQGWPVGEDGSISASPTDLNSLEPVQVAGLVGDASATTSAAISANLQSSQAVSAAAATYDATASATNMASGAVTPDFQVPLQIYDSQGGLHTLTFAFLKTGANTWQSEVFLPAGESVAGATLIDGQLAAGTVAFTPFGQIDAAATTLPTSLTINASGAATGPAWAASAGLGAQTVALNFTAGGGFSGLTGFAADSLLGTSQVNGTPFGSLSSVDVDDNGFVTALFTNGLTRQLYQIPVATFQNSDALTAEQGGVYRLSSEAGNFAMRAAGTAGAGQLQSRALEASTVDLAEEFSNLIITQRAYSASSKIITTADEMMDELIRLKR